PIWAVWMSDCSKTVSIIRGRAFRLARSVSAENRRECTLSLHQAAGICLGAPPSLYLMRTGNLRSYMKQETESSTDRLTKMNIKSCSNRWKMIMIKLKTPVGWRHNDFQSSKSGYGYVGS